MKANNLLLVDHRVRIGKKIYSRYWEALHSISSYHTPCSVGEQNPLWVGSVAQIILYGYITKSIEARSPLRFSSCPLLRTQKDHII